jgi:hypothetical protein
MSAFGAAVTAASVALVLVAVAAYLVGIPLWAVAAGTLGLAALLFSWASRRARRDSVRENTEA